MFSLFLIPPAWFILEQSFSWRMTVFIAASSHDGGMFTSAIIHLWGLSLAYNAVKYAPVCVHRSSKISKSVIFFILVSGSSHKQHMATRACVDVTRILDLSSCKPRANTQTLAVEFLVNAQKLIQGIIVPGNVHCLDSTRIPSPAGLYTHTLTCWTLHAYPHLLGDALPPHTRVLQRTVGVPCIWRKPNHRPCKVLDEFLVCEARPRKLPCVECGFSCVLVY